MDTASSTFSKKKPTYASSIHTPSLVHSLQLYPPVPAPHHTPIVTYGKSEPPSPSHDSSAESVTPKVNSTPHKTQPIRY